MNHMVDTCPLTKFEGGLKLLHDADDDAVVCLESFSIFNIFLIGTTRLKKYVEND